MVLVVYPDQALPSDLMDDPGKFLFGDGQLIPDLEIVIIDGLGRIMKKIGDLTAFRDSQPYQGKYSQLRRKKIARLGKNFLSLQ